MSKSTLSKARRYVVRRPPVAIKAVPEDRAPVQTATAQRKAEAAAGIAFHRLMSRPDLTPQNHPFLAGCALAGVQPDIDEFCRWRKGRGVALRAAWAKWPRAKNLPMPKPDSGAAE